MTPEEAHRLTTKVERLRGLGKRMVSRDTAKLPPERRYSDDHQFELHVWLDDVVETVTDIFKDGSSLSNRARRVAEGYNDNEKRTAEWVFKEGEPLLDLVLDYMTIDEPSPASEALKGLIDSSIKEGYFNSWPFRWALLAFGLALATIFGGTIYSSWQVQSISAQAEAAKASISAEGDKVKTATKEAVSEVQRRATQEAEDAIRNLSTAVSQSEEKIRLLTDKIDVATQSVTKVSTQGQESIGGAVQKAVAQAREDVASEVAKKQPQIDDAIRNLSTEVSQSDERLRSLTGKIDAAMQSVAEASTGGRESIKAAVQKAVERAPADVASELAKQQPQIDNAVKDGLKEIVDKVTQKTATLDSLQKDFDHQLEAARHDMSQSTTLDTDRVKDFNDTIYKYTGPITDILARLQGNNNLSAVDAVARVLGVATWIVLSSLLVSVLAFLMAIGAWLRH